MRRTIADLQRQADSVSTVLESLELRKKEYDGLFGRPLDAQYAEEQPFVRMSLVDTCKTIFAQQGATVYLTKTQVEYLARMGGYPFTTENGKNSVDVTLRRLTDQEVLEVDRAGGQIGNRYRMPLAFWKGIMRDEFLQALEKQDEKKRTAERREADAASPKAGAK